jgi:hypothetical protein
MTLKGFAEFIGYWVGGLSPETPILRYQKKCYGHNQGSFRMFIDSRQSIGNSTQRLHGRIKDRYGRATFDCVLTPTAIKISKRYEEGRSDDSVAGRTIIYRGRLEKDGSMKFYAGDYWFFVQEGHRKIKCVGKFLLEKSSPSKTLEHLMRMDT